MRLNLVWPVLVAVLAAGCASGDAKDGKRAAAPKKRATPKEEAVQHWNHSRATVMLGLASDQYRTGNFDKSRQTADEALRIDPQNVPLRLLSARLAIEQGQLDRASQELKLARELDPKSAEADYLTGVVYQRWQRPQTALDHYTAAAEKAPGELAYVLARAEMLVAVDRSDEALGLLQERVVYFEHSAVIRDAVGQLLVQRGRYREAADVLRQASILASEDLTIREHLALALYYDGRYREAADELVRLTKNDAYAERADLITALGECRMQTGNVREARVLFEMAAQFAPASPGVWLSLGKAALQLGDERRAELSLRKALSIDPGNPEGHLMFGYLRLRQGRPDDALASFQKASTLDADDTVSLCMVGYVLEQLGRGSEAMGYYARALKLRPNDELASKLMASVELGD